MTIIQQTSTDRSRNQINDVRQDNSPPIASSSSPTQSPTNSLLREDTAATSISRPTTTRRVTPRGSRSRNASTSNLDATGERVGLTADSDTSNRDEHSQAQNQTQEQDQNPNLTTPEDRNESTNANENDECTTNENDNPRIDKYHIVNEGGGRASSLRRPNSSRLPVRRQSHSHGRNNHQNLNPNQIGHVESVRLEITVSTDAPPHNQLAILHAQYPGEFEHFSDDELINALTNFITRYVRSFRALKAASVPAVTDLKAVFYSLTPPTITLRAYVHRLVMYSKVARIHFLMMTVYVDRLAATSMALVPSERNAHRILSGALALAVSQHEGVLDKPHACRVSGIASTGELDKIVSVFKQNIGENTALSGEEIVSAFNRLNAMKHTEELPEEDTMSVLTVAAAERARTESERHRTGSDQTGSGSEH